MDHDTELTLKTFMGFVIAIGFIWSFYFNNIAGSLKNIADELRKLRELEEKAQKEKK